VASASELFEQYQIGTFHIPGRLRDEYRATRMGD